MLFSLPRLDFSFSLCLSSISSDYRPTLITFCLHTSFPLPTKHLSPSDLFYFYSFIVCLSLQEYQLYKGRYFVLLSGILFFE